jgi:hypothetical protein
MCSIKQSKRNISRKDGNVKMAKFKIEVDLDFLDEEQKIDEVLRDEIVSSVKKYHNQKCYC